MNQITINFSAEDRARLDRIIAALESAGTPFKAPIAEPEKPAKKAPEAEPQVNTNPEPEAPKAEEKPVAEAPKVTAQDVQNLVVKLVGLGLKDQARVIVNEYAPRVGEIPHEQLPLVYGRLTALEKGGAE